VFWLIVDELVVVVFVILDGDGGLFIVVLIVLVGVWGVKF